VKLSDLEIGEKASIVSIDADSELRNRLHSFGIATGEELEVKGHSLAKRTIEIDIDRTLIVLRKEEADRIAVEKV